jgi:autotransporter passenger strand-loop-strand repeat protein
MSTIISGPTVINDGNIHSGDTVVSGGCVYLEDGTLEDSLVTSGGTIVIEDVGAFGLALTVGSGGMLDITAGGTAIDSNIEAGGTEIVSSGGLEILASAAAVDGALDVLSGGIVSVTGEAIPGAIHFSGGTASLGDGVTDSDVALESRQLAALIVSGTASVTAANLASGTVITAEIGGFISHSLIGSGATALVEGGGTAIDDTVRAGGLEEVFSGGLSVLNNAAAINGSLKILAGGVLSVTEATLPSRVIFQGGTAILGAGATADAETIQSGALADLIVSGGGVLENPTLLAGGTELILTGGTLLARTAAQIAAATFSGGIAVLSGSDDIIGASLSENGIDALAVSAGGVASNTTIGSGATEIVAAGGTDSGALVDAGGSEMVASGGVAGGGTVFGLLGITSGATLGAEIFSGGTELAGTGLDVSNITLTSGGLQGLVIGSGATAGNITISAGATLLVETGATIEGPIVYAGGVEAVASGTTLQGATVGAGQILQIGMGAVTETLSILGGGTEIVSAGGLASGSVVSSGATEIVSSGGTAIDTHIMSGGELDILAGAHATGSVFSAGTEVLIGDTVSGAFVDGMKLLEVTETSLTSDSLIVGGTEVLSDPTGAASEHDVIGAGGTLIVGENGFEGGDTVSSGGVEIVESGGTDGYISNPGSFGPTTIKSGGTQIVSAGGTAAYAVISAGGTQIVLAGGLVRDATATLPETAFSGGSLSLDGAAENITLSANGLQTLYVTEDYIQNSTGSVTDATITSGTELDLQQGEVTSATIESGGLLVVDAGAITDITVLSGGSLQVNSGAFDTVTLHGGGSFTLDLASGSGLVVLSGAVLSSYDSLDSGTDIMAGATYLVGFGDATSISDDGFVQVGNGGNTTSTFIGIGATETVQKTALAIATHIASGGTQFVSGAASASLVSAGATEVLTGGLSQVATIETGGSEIVSSGGEASAATIQAGGTEIVFGGGTSVDTTIMSGASETVFSGGNVYGALVEAGGTLVLSSGGTVSLPQFSADTNIVRGSLIIEAGASCNGDETQSGGVEQARGFALGTFVDSGGTEIVEAGGTAYADQVGPYRAAQTTGLMEVMSGGSGLDLVLGGASLLVDQGGYAQIYEQDTGAGFVHSGGSLLIADQEGGLETVSAGGYLSAVMRGGDVAVLSSATAYVSLDGGTETIDSGATTTTDLSVVSFHGATIDLADVTYVSGGTARLDTAHDTLTVSEGGHTTTLQLSGDYTGDYIHLAADGGTGTDITADQTPCYCTGTLIRIARAGRLFDMAVEALKLGDCAVTVSGRHVPIRWIGHRSLDEGFLAAHPDVRPVRILAGAFGKDLPARNLYLSPGHPVLVGAGEDGESGVLVPIMCLINGTSIARETKGDGVTYWHVELEQHDIMLAEGLPAESFLDFGNRPWFENSAEHAFSNPDFIPPGLSGRCRPVAVDGPTVEAERRRIDTLFAVALEMHCRWPGQDGFYGQAANELCKNR